MLSFQAYIHIQVYLLIEWKRNENKLDLVQRINKISDNVLFMYRHNTMYVVVVHSKREYIESQTPRVMRWVPKVVNQEWREKFKFNVTIRATGEIKPHGPCPSWILYFIRALFTWILRAKWRNCGCTESD